MENSIYYDEQRLSRIWFWLSICVIDALLFYVVFTLFLGTIGTALFTIACVVLITAAGLDVYLFLFLKLVIKIDFNFLYISMIPFFAIRIPIGEISFTEIVRLNKFRDYGGAGLGNSFNGKDPAYFLTGKIGVRVYYPLSNKLIVGAANPQRFINAIQYAQQRKRILSEMD